MFFFFDKDKIPSFDKMLKPTLQALLNLGGSANIDDLDKEVVEIMQLSNEISTILHEPNSSRTEVSYRLAWARTYLKKYGLIENTSRGMWSLTHAFKGNLDDINSNEIIQSVRQNNLKTFTDINITTLESAMAFEKFVLSFLSEYAKKQNKKINFLHSLNNNNYDAYLPHGIDNYNEPIVVEIKLFRSNLNIQAINIFCEKLVANNIKNKILLILGNTLTEKERERIITHISNRYNIDILVWDYSDIEQRLDSNAKYLEYLDNPKKAIVEDAINNQASNEKIKKKQKELIETLSSAYHNQEITLFLGAGVSIEAGIPSWTELINKLLINMILKMSEDKRLDSKAIDKLNLLACKNKEDSPLTQIRYIRAAFNNWEYQKIVHKALYSNKIDEDTALLNSIINVCTPRRNHIGVKSIVTYNFDDLIERKLQKSRIEYNVIHKESDLLTVNDLNIYHVHGYLPQNNEDKFDSEVNLVFSEEDYHKIYRDAYSWSNLTQLNSFRDSTCLFIGCSLTDPNLRRLLDVAARNGEKPRHYAIMKKKQLEIIDNMSRKDKIFDIYENIDNSIRESFFQSLGLNIIWIDSFSQIPEILNSLTK